MTFITSPDWFGEESPFVPKMRLELSDKRLRFEFRAEKTPLCDMEVGPGDFVQGLWENDVAELFLAGPGDGYQEINISPTGAWWSAWFSGYRELEREVPFKPRIEPSYGEARWQVSFEARLDDIVPWCSVPADQRRISVASILYDPEPHYFVWGHRSGGEPDFHSAHLFQPVVNFM